MNIQRITAIQNSPYRVLGVYANASAREIVGNKGRANAFLKVNKEVSFSCDFNQILPSLVRTAEMMADADSKLTLPKDKVQAALFWFVKVTPLDEIAFNHLNAADIPGAIAIWDRKQCFSSLLNKSVVALIQGNYSLAVDCMITLLMNDEYRDEFIHTIADSTFQISEEELTHVYLDVLIQEMGNNVSSLLQCLTIPNHKNYVQGKLVAPIINKIETEIAEANAVDHKSSSQRYNAGMRLMQKADPMMNKLSSFLSKSDMQYQMIADKLGLEVLQCGIDYYNNSNEADAAIKAMKLQKYAQGIVVGKMAKDRCLENVRILQKIIDEMPPLEVLEEDKAIQRELNNYIHPSKIRESITRVYFNQVMNESKDFLSPLRRIKPLLDSIKRKVGTSCNYYWDISELVVNIFLSDVIDYVNNANNRLEYKMISNRTNAINEIKSVVNNAMSVINYLDSFGMRPSFRSKRFNPNKETLKKLYHQLHLDGSMSEEDKANLIRWIVAIIMFIIFCTVMSEL